MCSSKTLLILIMSIAVSGCTYTTTPSINTAYHFDLPKIQKNVHLIIPPETLTKVTDNSYGWDTYRVPIGLILEQNGPTAFKTIFANVSTEPSKQKPDWSITLTSKPETKIGLGLFTFSEQSFTTALQCDITAPDGRLAWTKSIVTEATGRRALEAVGTALSPGTGILLSAIANPECKGSGYLCALQDAANASSAKALRELLDDIYQNKDQIFK